MYFHKIWLLLVTVSQLQWTPFEKHTTVFACLSSMTRKVFTKVKGGLNSCRKNMELAFYTWCSCFTSLIILRYFKKRERIHQGCYALHTFIIFLNSSHREFLTFSHCQSYIYDASTAATQRPHVMYLVNRRTYCISETCYTISVTFLIQNCIYFLMFFLVPKIFTFYMNCALKFEHTTPRPKRWCV